MMTKDKHKLTLDRPEPYRITVPGTLDVNRLDWNVGMKVTVENDKHGVPITILTIIVDQAALPSLLRYLYSLGLPLISVISVDFN